MVYTSATQRWLSMFDATHVERANGFGAAWWERVSLPETGGLSDQANLDLEAMDWIRLVANDELRIDIEHARRAAAAQETGDVER